MLFGEAFKTSTHKQEGRQTAAQKLLRIAGFSTIYWHFCF
jgi:hypothetical protein